MYFKKNIFDSKTLEQCLEEADAILLLFLTLPVIKTKIGSKTQKQWKVMIVEEHLPQEGTDAFLLPFLTPCDQTEKLIKT